MYRIRSFVVFSVSLAWYSALFAAVIRVPPPVGGPPLPTSMPAEIEKAISDANEAIRANPNNAKSYLARGKAYLTQGQIDNSLADFDAAVKLDPADAEVYFHRATARQRRELIEQAIDDLTSAIRLRPDYAEAYHNRGLLFVQQEDILEAISDFASALKIDPENAMARSLRESTSARLSELFRTSLTGGLSATRTGTVVVVQDVQKEIARQTAAIVANPRSSDAYLKRSMAYERLNDSIRALADASEALRLAPDNAQLRLRRALLYFRLRDREKATKDCEEAVRLQPGGADAYTIRAILYIGDGQHEKGVADLTTAARTNPNAPFVHFNLGLVHEAGGELDAAIAAYTEAIRLAPRDDSAFTRRGRVYARKGDDALAVKDFTQAISLAPTVVRAYQQRAAVYRKLGNQVAADRDLDLADFFQRESHRSISYQTPNGAKAAADTLPEVSLTPERWQALPGNIVGVNVAPDGRAWYEAQLNRNHVDSVADHIARIQSQFSRPAPVIIDSRIALFEPGGRVWIYADSRVLLGHDGKTWLPRSLADENETLAGRCTTRGGLMAGDVNRSAGGTAWFLGQRGVYRFDGADWHYQVLGNSQMHGSRNGIDKPRAWRRWDNLDAHPRRAMPSLQLGRRRDCIVAIRPEVPVAQPASSGRKRPDLHCFQRHQRRRLAVWARYGDHRRRRQGRLAERPRLRARVERSRFPVAYPSRAREFGQRGMVAV
ncbi:MAG: tetratricopeptide repeat protein [Thermoguttaceae bacterium]